MKWCLVLEVYGAAGKLAEARRTRGGNYQPIKPESLLPVIDKSGEYKVYSMLYSQRNNLLFDITSVAMAMP